jgi:hypothetical protein
VISNYCFTDFGITESGITEVRYNGSIGIKGIKGIKEVKGVSVFII